MTELKPVPQDYIYVLDIGTRNVVGILAHKNEAGKLRIIAHAIQNHQDRAMYDGQIHDIGKVQKIISKITDEISELTGYELKNVRIAAAGRALKTIKTNASEMLDINEQITQKTIHKLEAEGIQNAQIEMDKNSQNEGLNYYCVGYSTTTCSLDGIDITNPLGHRGNELELTLIVTFLPRSVVDSLYTAVDKAGLTVSHLTLEPIAALAIAVPEKFRLLNIALVDIGAGTSDIAITKDGLISAYGMVDVAGDELTEVLVNKYLLDFDMAETLKVSLNDDTDKTFTDIVGMTHTKSRQEIIATLEEDISLIAKTIGDEILRINDGSPSAIFLIGGGAEIPGIAEHLAKVVDTPKERIVVKPVETLESVIFDTEPLVGPKFITPLGIAFAEVDNESDDFLELVVNGSKVKLYNTKELKVLDALVLLGHNTRALLPIKSKRLLISVNGEIKRLKGEPGEPAVVKINGVESSLDAPVVSGDDIIVRFATQGTLPTVKLSDFVALNKTITYQNKLFYLAQNIMLNGKAQSEDVALQSGDKINYHAIQTLQHLCDYVDIDISEVIVNGNVMSSDYLLQHGDNVTFIPTKNDKNTDVDLNKQIENTPTQKLDFAEKKVLNVTINGEHVTLLSDKEHVIFVDVFDEIDFDLSQPKGIIDLRLNGKPAKYMDVLNEGDDIIVRWR